MTSMPPGARALVQHRKQAASCALVSSASFSVPNRSSARSAWACSTAQRQRLRECACSPSSRSHLHGEVGDISLQEGQLHALTAGVPLCSIQHGSAVVHGGDTQALLGCRTRMAGGATPAACYWSARGRLLCVYVSSVLPQLQHARSGTACLLPKDGQMERHLQSWVTVPKGCVIQLWQGKQASCWVCACLFITCLLRLVSSGQSFERGMDLQGAPATAVAKHCIRLCRADRRAAGWTCIVLRGVRAAQLALVIWGHRRPST